MALDLVARLRLKDDLSGKMKRATRTMADAERRTRGLSTGFAKLGGVMAGLGVSVGMAAIGKSVVQTGIDFTTTMSKVQAVSGATGSEMEKLTAQARDLGKTTIHSATQAADAQAFLGQAGFKTNEILATMPGLLDLATAGQLDLGRAADIASNVMTGFNLKATDMSRIADVLAQSAANANTDVEQMGMAMSYIAPIASAMGVSLEETAAGIGLLSNAGIQGERAGTALRGVIGALGDPTKALARQLSGVGLSIDDVNPRVNSLADIIENLTDSGLTAADAIELVGLNAGPGLAALMTAGADNLRGFTKDMENAGGAAKTMAAIISDNLGADIKLFDSAREETNLKIFEKFEGKIRGFIQGATKAVEKIPAVVDKIVALGTAAKPVVTAFMPLIKALALFGGAVLAIEAVLGIIGMFAGALAFLAGPVGIAALAITGIVLGFQAFYKHSETFRAAVDQVVGAVSGLFKMFTGDGVGAFTTFLDAGLSMDKIKKLQQFKADISRELTEIKTAFTDGGTVGLAQAIGLSPEAIAAVLGAISSMKSAFESVKESVGGFITTIQPGIATLLGAFSGFGTTLMSVFTTLWSVISPVFSGLATAFHIIADVAGMVFNNIVVPAVQFAITAFQTLWAIVGPILNLLGAAIQINFAILRIVWDTILSPFVSFMTGVFKSAIELATPVLEKLGGGFEKVGGFISTVADHLRAFSKLLSSVKVPEWLGSIGGKISGAAKSLGGLIGGGKAIPGHYHGLDRVQTDGYIAKLHRGEKVLTRQEADRYDAIMPNMAQATQLKAVSNVVNLTEYRESKQDRYAGMEYDAATASITNDNRTYNSYTTEGSGENGGRPSITIAKLADSIVIREEADIDKFAGIFVDRLIQAGEMGAI